MAVGVTVGALTLARGAGTTSCGHGRALPERGHAYDLPRLGPLTLQAGFRGDFVRGYPYKVAITRCNAWVTGLHG